MPIVRVNTWNEFVETLQDPEQETGSFELVPGMQKKYLAEESASKLLGPPAVADGSAGGVRPF